LPELLEELGHGVADRAGFSDRDPDQCAERSTATWSRVAASVGMPEVTFHALRHTHASQLIDAGVDVVTISRRLGHASPTVTLQVYAHLFRKDDSKASDAINEALAGLGSA
jgi:integrase